MPTDDKRRRVAAALREKHRERTRPGQFEPQDVNLQAWCYLKDLESCVPDGDSLFTVLADLIEPDCDESRKDFQPNDTCDRDALMVVAESMDHGAALYREAARIFAESGNHDAAEVCCEAAFENNGYAKVIREALEVES